MKKLLSPKTLSAIFAVSLVLLAGVSYAVLMPEHVNILLGDMPHQGIYQVKGVNDHKIALSRLSEEDKWEKPKTYPARNMGKDEFNHKILPKKFVVVLISHYNDEWMVSQHDTFAGALRDWHAHWAEVKKK